MERGALAIFGEADLATSNSLRSFVNYYNVPFFTWSYPAFNDFNVDYIEKKSDLETVVNDNYESSNKAKKLYYLPWFKRSRTLNKQPCSKYLVETTRHCSFHARMVLSSD